MSYQQSSAISEISENEKVLTLDQLAPGDSCMVLSLRGQGSVHRRLLDMGLSKGALVELECEAPLRDPIKIKLRGYALSLRKSEAKLVCVKRISL